MKQKKVGELLVGDKQIFLKGVEIIECGEVEDKTSKRLGTLIKMRKGVIKDNTGRVDVVVFGEDNVKSLSKGKKVNLVDCNCSNYFGRLLITIEEFGGVRDG